MTPGELHDLGPLDGLTSAEAIDLDDPDETEPIAAHPTARETVDRLVPVVRRHRRALVAGTSGAVALLVVGTWWSGRPAYPVPDRPLRELAPAALTVTATHVTSSPGSPTATLALDVRNTSTAPITVATVHRPSTGVEVDSSVGVTVPPGGTAPLTARLLVHDCSTGPRLTALGELPGAAPGSDPASPGITLRARLGDETTEVSLPVAAQTVGPSLRAGACAGRPGLSVELRAAEPVPSSSGWQVLARYAVRTDGIGVSVGREHFTSTVAGSVLSTPGTLDAGSSWWAAPVQLDGGAGRIPVTFAGSSCDSLAASSPPTLPVTVTMADHSVYAFEVPAHDVRLARAAYAACGTSLPAGLPALGWRAVANASAPAPG